MKVLDVTNGVSNAYKLFEDSEITVLTLDELKEKELQPEYDLVICAHNLQFLYRDEVKPIVAKMAAGVKHLGELWLITPSLEWAAAELIKDSPSPVVLFVMYGDQLNAFHTSFTLLWLRNLAEQAGLIARQVNQAPYEIIRDGKPIIVPQNVVYAMKVVQ